MADFEFDLSVPSIEQHLELKPGDVRLALRGLHSVIKVPTDAYPEVGHHWQDIAVTWTAHHASFLDFLREPTRSGEFCIGCLDHRENLVRCVLRAFSFYDAPLRNHTGDVAWYRPPNPPEMIPKYY